MTGGRTEPRMDSRCRIVLALWWEMVSGKPAEESVKSEAQLRDAFEFFTEWVRCAIWQKALETLKQHRSECGDGAWPVLLDKGPVSELFKKCFSPTRKAGRDGTPAWKFLLHHVPEGV